MPSTSVSCTPFTSCHCRHWSALSCFYAFSHHHHVSAGYTQTLKENIHYGLWEIQCLPRQHLSAAVTTCNNAETVYVSKCWSGAVFPKHVCSQAPFWLKKITMNFHILAHVNIQCPDDRYPKLNPYNSELMSVSYEYRPVAYVKMHCMIWPNYWLLLTLQVEEFP